MALQMVDLKGTIYAFILSHV